MPSIVYFILFDVIPYICKLAYGVDVPIPIFIIFDNGDKTRNNIDTITLRISDSYDGDSVDSLPFSFEIFRLMEISNKDILVKINVKLGLVIFEILDNYNKMLYVMSSLIK